MSKTNIIDGNSIGHAAHRATKLSVGGRPTQAIFGFIKTMRDMKVKHKDFTPMVLWDGRAQWRFDLHPLYKSNRDNDPKKVAEREAYQQQKPTIIEALASLGIRQVTVATHEADDMAGYFVGQLTAKPGNEIILSTGDHDWMQLVRPGVTWMDHRDEAKIVTFDKFHEKTGYATPYAFLEGKCLHGDTSDVISGVGGIGEDGAPLVLAEFGSVREFWRRCDSGEYTPKKKALLNLWKGCSEFTKEQWAAQYTGDPADAKALKKHMDEWPGQGRIIFGRNLRLMQLLKPIPPKKEDVKVIQKPFNAEWFKQICEDHAFLSILNNFETFIQPFKGA